MKTLDLLLKGHLGSIKDIKKEIKIKRLSKDLGEDVIFQIKALSLDRLEEIRKNNTTDFHAHVILEGVKEPNLKDKELNELYKAITPVELINALLLPGEIEDIYLSISKLSGYGSKTIEDIKKK